MKLAYMAAPGRGDTDLILFQLANNLATRGLKVGGVVQINTDRIDGGSCDMDVQVLPDGPVMRISQNLGRSARGCRLNPAALESAVGLVSASLVRGADVLIINKFGKHEVQGRGFREVIAEALAMDVPVVVGLNVLNSPDFEDFSGGLAIRLPPVLAAIEEWVSESVASKQSNAS